MSVPTPRSAPDERPPAESRPEPRESASAGYPPSPFAGLGRGFDAALLRGVNNITRRALGPYQTAIVRIGFAFTMLLYLVREWPNRGLLYGPDSPWSYDLASRFVEDTGAFTPLLWSDSALWFEFVYHLAILACVALLVGWRTRASSMLFMIGVLAVQNRSVFMGDGGDNVIHLMAMYLVLTRCGQVWSLDARRRARRAAAGVPATRDPVGVAIWAVLGAALLLAIVTGSLDSLVWSLFFGGMWLVHAFWWLIRRYANGEPRIVSEMIGNLVHNAALLVIMFEVCIIYATAGWYKIQGSRWQDGTAVFYPLNLDYFNAWPELSELIAGSGLLVLALSYGTVFAQVVFPFALLNRRAKNVLLVILVGEHLGIALLLGLPFFSLAMIAMDAVFLPTAFLLWLGGRVSWATAPLTRLAGRRRPASQAAQPVGAATEPAQHEAQREARQAAEPAPPAGAERP
ncbi:HTTM domain-containing protein [Streptomyces sp. DSM 44915]|uniref:HTTM domain-containing protein n=1 Tax=Streptomyces chisholmiae TaxID=3075540 RepID=A0ABU2JRT4_9ACTN|nr:HTTM domain-containing protein [Streptomyces sp. DSM 44915]MDT0266948.1 HTTM domain-containing protein [Streptomyces sp. DSM 44915]